MQLQLRSLSQRLHSSIRQTLATARAQSKQLAHALHTVSPLSTLARGYSILTTSRHKIVRRIADVKQGDTVMAKLVDGDLACEVTKIQSRK